MKGQFINCANPNCRKMLLKDAWLRPGSFLTMKCPHCEVTHKLQSEEGRLRIIVIRPKKEEPPFTNDDEDDIVMLNV